MTNYNINQIRKVFNQADNYFIFVDGMKYKLGDCLYLNPYYINCLFCCELYLKTMLMIDGVDYIQIKKAKHNLKKLFNLIKDDEVKEKLINDLNGRLENMFDARHFLDSVQNDFVHIRYMYIEKNNKFESRLNDNFPCCIMFMYVLRNYLDLKINGKDTYEDVINNVSI